MNNRITQFIIADNEMNAWEDENIDDSPERESLYESVHDAWFNLHGEESESLLIVYNLSLSHDPKTLDLLTLYLSDNRWFVRRNAIHEIGKIVQKNTVELLIDSLSDENPFVCYSAIRALGLIADHRASPMLDKMANNTENNLKPFIIKSIDRISKINMPKSIKFGLKQDYTDFLCGIIDNDHWFNRRYAAHWLGKVGTRKNIPLLVNALQDENSGVRYEAAKALGLIRCYESLEPLQGLLSDTNSIVAGAAMGSIEFIKNWGESRSDYL